MASKEAYIVVQMSDALNAEADALNHAQAFFTFFLTQVVTKMPLRGEFSSKVVVASIDSHVPGPGGDN